MENAQSDAEHYLSRPLADCISSVDQLHFGGQRCRQVASMNMDLHGLGKIAKRADMDLMKDDLARSR